MCALRKPEILSIESQETNKGESPEYLWKNFLMSPKSQQKTATSNKLNRLITSEPLTMERKETSQVNIHESSKRIKPTTFINKMEEQSQHTIVPMPISAQNSAVEYYCLQHARRESPPSSKTKLEKIAHFAEMDRLRNNPTAERDILFKDDSFGIASGEAPSHPLKKPEHVSRFDKPDYENAEHPDIDAGIDAETLVKLRLYYTMKGSEIAYFDDDRVPTDELKKNNFAIKMIVEKTIQEPPKITCIFHKPMKMLPGRKYDTTGNNVSHQSTCGCTEHAVSLNGADKPDVVHNSSSFEKLVEKNAIEVPQKKTSSMHKHMKSMPSRIYDTTGKNASLTNTCTRVEHAVSLHGTDKPEVVHSNSTVQKLVEKNTIPVPQKRTSSMKSRPSSTYDNTGKNASLAGTCEHTEHAASIHGADKPEVVHSNSPAQKPIEENIQEPDKISCSIEEPIKIAHQTANKKGSHTSVHEHVKHDVSQPEGNKTGGVCSSSAIGEPVEKNKHHEPHKMTSSIHEPMKMQTSTSHETVIKKVTTPTISLEDTKHNKSQPKAVKAKLVNSSSIIRETRATRVVSTLFIKKYGTTNEPETGAGTQPICFLEKHKGKLVRVEYAPASEHSSSVKKPLYQTRVLDVEKTNTDLSKQKHSRGQAPVVKGRRSPKTSSMQHSQMQDELRPKRDLENSVPCPEEITILESAPSLFETQDKEPQREEQVASVCKLKKLWSTFCIAFKTGEQSTCENEPKITRESNKINCLRDNAKVAPCPTSFST